MNFYKTLIELINNIVNSSLDSKVMEDSLFSELSTLFYIATIITIIILVGLIVFGIIVVIKVYKKMGRMGWEAILPIYNNWVLVEVSGLNWWWFLFTLIGLYVDNYIIILLMLFGNFVINYNIAKRFKKDFGFSIVLTILPLIGYAIIAFSKNMEFDKSIEVSKNGPFK